MKFKNIFIIGLFVSLFISCTNDNKHTVKISKRAILVNNSLYSIKGICYHPVPKGSPNKRDFGSLKEDILLMKEAGINTIRVYAPIEEKWVLDEFALNDIKVIIGFGYDQDGYYDMVSGSFIDYVNKYKNHKAILMWELGNEYNYHPEWFNGDLKNWYKALNAAAALIHQNDMNHPVTTAHGDLPDKLALELSPNIDVWGLNVYRWDKPGTIYKEWESVSDKPMYLSEAGADSYMTIAKDGYDNGENQKAQADANANILKEVFDNNHIGCGVAIFSFTDGWWKAGNYDKQDPGGWAPNSSGVPYDGSPNEEYWGIVDLDRNKKQTFDVVKKAYQEIKK
jgi:exo-beta-1,3-glucanase (GH17 family)